MLWTHAANSVCLVPSQPQQSGPSMLSGALISLPSTQYWVHELNLPQTGGL